MAYWRRLSSLIRALLSLVVVTLEPVPEIVSLDSDVQPSKAPALYAISLPPMVTDSSDERELNAVNSILDTSPLNCILFRLCNISVLVLVLETEFTLSENSSSTKFSNEEKSLRSIE